MGANAKLYDRDFYAWTREQAELLRSGRVAEADLDNLAEEIKSMGRGERREIVNRFVVLLSHLAMWMWQSDRRGRSWRLTVEEQRLQIARLLDDNPSLRPSQAELVAEAWPLACVRARRETSLDASAFPTECPWTPEQALDDAFLPE